MTQHDSEAVDMVLVGAGIMSATLAVLLKELDPNIKLEIVELQESGAIESSNPWNNAGTGVVPRVGAFDGSGFLQLDDFQLDIGIEFLEQYRQGRTHDAGSHQHHIHCFAIVLRHQRVLQNHSIKLS